VVCTHFGTRNQTGDFYLQCTSQEAADNIMAAFNKNRPPGMVIRYGPQSLDKAPSFPTSAASFNSYSQQIQKIRSRALQALAPPPKDSSLPASPQPDGTGSPPTSMDGVTPSDASNKRPRSPSDDRVPLKTLLTIPPSPSPDNGGGGGGGGGGDSPPPPQGDGDHVPN
jgi:hypothetical protein